MHSNLTAECVVWINSCLKNLRDEFGSARLTKLDLKVDYKGAHCSFNFRKDYAAFITAVKKGVGELNKDDDYREEDTDEADPHN